MADDTAFYLGGWLGNGERYVLHVEPTPEAVLTCIQWESLGRRSG